MSDVQGDNDTVLHQGAHEALAEASAAKELEETSDHAAIADLVALTGGEAPTEAEHNAVRVAVNEILDVLRDAGLIPAS